MLHPIPENASASNKNINLMEIINPIAKSTISSKEIKNQPPKPSEFVQKDLTKLTEPQLQEMYERQQKILRNKRFISNLPDKGKKLQDLFNRIDQEIKRRNQINEAADLFSNLNITSTGKLTATITMEWQGRDALANLATNKSAKDELLTVENNADDDDGDDENRITLEDRKEIDSFKLDGGVSAGISNVELEPYALHGCEIEKRQELQKKDRYLPHKTLRSNVFQTDCNGKLSPKSHSSSPKSSNSLTNCNTGPVGEAKILSIQDSINIQKQQIDLLKKIEEKNAIERLSRRNELLSKIKMQSPNLSTTSSMKYRNIKCTEGTDSDDDDEDEDDEESIGSDQEVHDDDDDRGGGVTVNIRD